MAISNLVTSSGYVNKPSIAGMFGKGPANDNLIKDSGLFSESFIVSASNSIMQLNDNLSKLQESSLSIIKSIDNIISKIRTLDKDMTQRFKKLNADITASRPEFGKFLVKAPPVPLADFAPGIIEQGKVANAAGGGGGGIAAAIAAGLGMGAARGGGAGGGARTQTPRTGGGGTGSGKDPVKTTTRPAPTAKTSSPSSDTPGSSSRTSPSSPRSPSGTPEYTSGMMKPPPRAGSPSGGPTTPTVKISKEELIAKQSKLTEGLKGGGKTAGRLLGPAAAVFSAVIAGFEANNEYKEYEKTGDKTHLKKTYEILGQEAGAQGAGFAGAIAGGLAGGPAGAVIGGLAGIVQGSESGLIVGRALYAHNHEGIDFQQALEIETLKVLKEKRDLLVSGQKERMQGNSVVTRGATTQLKKLQDDAAKVAAQLAKTQEDAIGGSAGYVGSVGDILEQSTKPADSTGAGEVKEESGERGTTSAPTGEAVPDPTKVKGRTPQSSTPAPSTPAAPPPTPRVDRTSGGGADVQVNNTTNTSSTTRGGDNQNVTNPNMKLNAQNEFLTNSLSRQMINVA